MQNRHELNDTQKYILKTYFMSIAEYLTDFEPLLAIKILKAMLAPQLSKHEIERYQALELWESIQQIRSIFSHPAPQNRSESYPYYQAPKEADMVVYKNEQGVAAIEVKGLLGLSARNDSTSPPVTKESVVNYLTDLIQEQIETHAKLNEMQKNKSGLISSDSLFNISSDILMMLFAELSFHDFIALSAVDTFLNKMLMSAESRISKSFWSRECRTFNTSLFFNGKPGQLSWFDKFKNIPRILQLLQSFNCKVSPEHALIHVIHLCSEDPKRYKSIALELIKLGVNTSCLDNQSALKIAMFYNQVEIVTALLPISDPEEVVNCILYNRNDSNLTKSHQYMTLLEAQLDITTEYDGISCARIMMGHAVETGDTALTEKLIACGMKIDMAPEAICTAAAGGHGEVLKLLINAGADPVKGLLSAADNDQQAIIDIILDLPIDMESALIGAAGCGYTDLTLKLIDRVKDVNCTSTKSYSQLERKLEPEEVLCNTALYNAVISGKIEIVKLLLERGANPLIGSHKINALYSSLLGTVVGNGSYEIYNLIQEKVDDLESSRSEFFASARTGDNRTLIRLLDAGADANEVILVAARNNQMETIKILLERKVDKQAAFIHAAIYGLSNLATILLEDGVNIDGMSNSISNDAHHTFRINFCTTALTAATLMQQKDIVKLLLEHGADPTVCNQEGVSAFTLAMRKRGEFLSNETQKEIADMIKENMSQRELESERPLYRK
jgi:ankyrin repeat protein